MARQSTGSFDELLLYLWRMGPTERKRIPKHLQDQPTNNRWVLESFGMLYLTRFGLEFLQSLPAWQFRHED